MAGLRRWRAAAGPDGRRADSGANNSAGAIAAQGDTLLTRDPEADTPMGVALRAAERGRRAYERRQAAEVAAKAETEQRRRKEEAEQRRIVDQQYQLARNETVTAANVMTHDDAYADLVYKAARARGERVQAIDPDFAGSRMNHSEAIEAKKLQRHLEHQADLEVERRAKSDAVGDTEIGLYVGPTEEGKRFLEDAANAEKFNKLKPWQVPLNEVERWWRQRQIISALYGIEEAPSTRAEILADIESAKQRAKQTRWLTRTEKHILTNEDRLRRIADTVEDKAFQDLHAAYMRYKQIPDSLALRKFARAKTAGERIEILLNDPFEFVAVKAGQALPKTAARAVGGRFGGPLGGMLAATGMAFGTKYAEAVVKGFESRGIDLGDESTVRETLKDKGLIQEIYNHASKEAGNAAVKQAAQEAARVWLLSRF